MASKSSTYKQSQISYIRSGTGPRLVFCLHGFNESAGSFSMLENPGNEFSIIALDLPFHGNTVWNEGLHFLPVDLNQIFSIIQKEEGFSADDPFYLIGFSLGGRLSLAFYQTYPQLISQLYLIAPDGLKTSFWYRLASQSKTGNYLFYQTMKYPGWFLKLADVLNTLKLINPGIRKFVAQYLNQKKVRDLLYDVWTAFSTFKPNIPLLKKTIQEYKTPIALYFGKYDNVIPPSHGISFIKGIEDESTITIINAGHRLLVENEIVKIFTNDKNRSTY